MHIRKVLLKVGIIKKIPSCHAQAMRKAAVPRILTCHLPSPAHRTLPAYINPSKLF